VPLVGGIERSFVEECLADAVVEVVEAVDGVTYLIWNSSDSGAPSWYTDIVWFVLVPAAVVVVLATAWRDRHRPIPEAALG
jgi:hypothetical protein